MICDDDLRSVLGYTTYGSWAAKEGSRPYLASFAAIYALAPYVAWLLTLLNLWPPRLAFLLFYAASS